jgi:hypothetical protein
MSFNSPFTGNVVQPTDVSYRSITLAANTQLEWPINGNATDDFAARIMQVTASSGGLSLYMPPANQASVGQDALIRNVGANTFTVKDYEGTNTIVSIAAGESKYIYITANSTATGTWGIIAFGVGTSSPDASVLAGAGLLASGATLNQSHPTASITAGYTFVTGDRAQTYIWTGGAGSATLPTATTTGNNWFVLVKNNGTGTLTISPSGGSLIDGGASKAFQPLESAIIVSTGTAYVTVGYGQSTTFEFGLLTKPVTTGAYTLTASEASNVIQIYTGTLTGNVTITYPPVVNFYAVSNQTVAGGFTLTLTTGIGGSATAQVPANGQATLFCDGTNFYNANTTQAGATALSIVSGSAGSPAINFAAETNTGLYRPGAGRFGISILGTQVLDVDANGIEVTGDVEGTNASFTGTGNFDSGISGGTFP